MDTEDINARCVDLVQKEDVKLRMWHPRMFWDVGDLDDPTPDDLTRPKFDLLELEVLLSAAALEESRCAADLNQREQGRADFIIRQVHRGELPLLRHV